MNKKKNKGERSAQMQEVSAGLQDVLGMNQWRAAHPQATLREIEEAVDAQMNQLRAQLVQELVHMGETSVVRNPCLAWHDFATRSCFSPRPYAVKPIETRFR